MSVLKFFHRQTNNHFTIDIDYNNYLFDIYHSIKKRLNIDNSIQIKIFCIESNDGKPATRVFMDGDKLEIMTKMIEERKVREFEVYYKTTLHGSQVADMSPSKSGTVVSGYKKWINKDGEGTHIGDPNGASIFIPKGALKESQTLSIKTIMVDDSELSKVGTNVTRGVGYNPNANKEMNKH